MPFLRDNSRPHGFGVLMPPNTEVSPLQLSPSEGEGVK
jgi:hypothetical protein